MGVIQNIVVAYHIVSHGAIWFCDFTQVVPLLDFIRRVDGKPSDPNNLLPLEMVYAGVTAMAFGIVGAAFLLALGGIMEMRGAAALSVILHGMWIVHMIWRWEFWEMMFVPSGSMMTPKFFFFSHVMWTLAAAFLFVYPGDEKPKSKKK
mmetsp:Transcript_36790/g.90537  ORF Transcript_36790/g.90537 Transcript_36790/m.90537 type:complete len:149 (+) Transcript_36790:94-540(+)